MKRLLIVLLLLPALPARATGYERHDARVAMSDGVTLEASLYLPAGIAGEVPLIVRQHGGGSNKDNPYDTGYGLNAVAAGFAVLMYSHRGHGNSQGEFDWFGPRTTKDFSEMLDWVEAAFGERVDTTNVGANGYSQGGGESLLPAEFDARVKAVAVGNTFADLNMALNPNDCFKLSWATGIFAAAYKVPGARTDDATAVRWGATFYTDTEDVPADGGPIQSTTAELRARSPLTYVGNLIDRRVPVFWAQSWEDQLFPGDHPARILAPLAARGIPVHYWFSSGGHAAGPDFPADLVAKEQAMLDWFDQFLRGNDHGFTTGPKVDYWQRVSPGRPGEWIHKTADAWPVPGTSTAAFYTRGDGTLSSQPGQPNERDRYVANDMASANVANDAIVNEVAGNFPGLGDVVRQVPEGANPVDTALFESAPLEGDVEFVGAPRVRGLELAPISPVLKGQVAVKLWDQGPDGATLLTRGCASTAYTAGFPIGFGPVALWPTAHRFLAGHQIVLTVSAIDSPTFKQESHPFVVGINGSFTRLELPVLS